MTLGVLLNHVSDIIRLTSLLQQKKNNNKNMSELLHQRYLNLLLDMKPLFICCFVFVLENNLAIFESIAKLMFHVVLWFRCHTPIFVAEWWGLETPNMNYVHTLIIIHIIIYIHFSRLMIEMNNHSKWVGQFAPVCNNSIHLSG